MVKPGDIKKFLTGESKKYPNFADKYNEFSSLYDQKLWHQLTVALRTFICDESNWRDGNLIDLYYNFIVDFEAALNQLKFVQIASVIARQYLRTKPPTATEVDEALKFMSEIEGKKEKKDKQPGFSDAAYIVARMASAELLLVHPDKTVSLEKALEYMDQVHNDVLPKLASSGGETVANSAYYRVCCAYYKLVGPAEKFYESGVQFLAYTLLDTLGKKEQENLAIDLSLSALVSPNIFNFGEILPQPILESLKETESAWLVELLKFFHEGDVDGFAKLIEIRQEETATGTGKFKILGENMEILRQKIGLMRLMKLIFDRVSTKRTISLELIAKETKIESDMVEWMLMKAMSKGLIKGKIDGVERVVHVSWLKPRVMQKSELKKLDDKLTEWREGVESALGFISKETPELFQSA